MGCINISIGLHNVNEIRELAAPEFVAPTKAGMTAPFVKYYFQIPSRVSVLLLGALCVIFSRTMLHGEDFLPLTSITKSNYAPPWKRIDDDR